MIGVRWERQWAEGIDIGGRVHYTLIQSTCSVALSVYGHGAHGTGEFFGEVRPWLKRTPLFPKKSWR